MRRIILGLVGLAALGLAFWVIGAVLPPWHTAGGGTVPKALVGLIVSTFLGGFGIIAHATGELIELWMGDR